MALKGFKLQGKISDHDSKIGEKLAYVLTGGDKAGLTKMVDEQYILDIEREAFVSLAGERLTQDRIKYMLKKGSRSGINHCFKDGNLFKLLSLNNDSSTSVSTCIFEKSISVLCPVITFVTCTFSTIK